MQMRVWVPCLRNPHACDRIHDQNFHRRRRSQRTVAMGYFRKYSRAFAMRKALFCFLLIVAPVFAQRGDKPGEVQVAPLKNSEIPPAPILSPAESLNTFKLQPGFKIELVAAEPLVQTPVAMAFHPDGSIYVVEM